MRHEGGVWLRGDKPDDATQRLLPRIACDGRFEVLPDGALLKPGQRVPLGKIPTGPWQPLVKFLAISLPSASVPSKTSTVVQIELVPSATAVEANVLVTDLMAWVIYGRQAPEVRLRHCQFAVCGDERVLVHGSILPPLAGIRAVERHGLVVPCGWMWSPAVDAKILTQAWSVAPGDLWLLWPGRLVECVRSHQLVAANHSAIQLTKEAFVHE